MPGRLNHDSVFGVALYTSGLSNKIYLARMRYLYEIHSARYSSKLIPFMYWLNQGSADRGQVSLFDQNQLDITAAF